MPTVALGSDFLDAYARCPRAQQKKVRDVTAKFQANPKSPGILLRHQRDGPFHRR